jgi:hypothetical protein
MNGMNETIGVQIAIYRGRLGDLIRRGLDVRDALFADPANPTALGNARIWQQDCGVVVNELSGGSKAHWLARGFSEAFLVRGSAGVAVEGVAPAEIVKRLTGVLGQALASLSQDEAPSQLSASQAPAPRRFDFVHNPELRPVLEQAYTDGRRAFDEGDYDLALLSNCGILESIVTDALQQKGLGALQTADAPAVDIADWPFETRLAVAEQSGLIGRGCARLPELARRYRDLSDGQRERASKLGATQRDARITGQVLHVVMRDLNPGR